MSDQEQIYDDPDEIDPVEVDREAYRPRGHSDRLTSLKSALAGLRYLMVREQSIQVLAFYSIVVIGFALWLNVNRTEMVELVLALGLAWITEALNTGIEAAVDLAMPDVHPLAKVAKDVGSAAALLSATLSLVVSIMLLGPPLIARLGT
jgi:diacylglycerol kinase